MFLLAAAAAATAAVATPLAGKVPAATATLSPAQQASLQAQLQSQIANAYKSPMAINHPWFTHTLAALFVIAAVLLVVLLAIQTTKQEGLTGTLGGRVESSYRGRLGFDQQLSRITSYIAISFVVLSTLLTFTGI